MSLAATLPLELEVARSLRVGLFTAMVNCLRMKRSAGSATLPAVDVLTIGKRSLRAGRADFRQRRPRTGPNYSNARRQADRGEQAVRAAAYGVKRTRMPSANSTMVAVTPIASASTRA